MKQGLEDCHSSFCRPCVFKGHFNEKEEQLYIQTLRNKGVMSATLPRSLKAAEIQTLPYVQQPEIYRVPNTFSLQLVMAFSVDQGLWDPELIVRLYVLNHFTSKPQATTAVRQTLQRRRQLKHSALKPKSSFQISLSRIKNTWPVFPKEGELRCIINIHHF